MQLRTGTMQRGRPTYAKRAKTNVVQQMTALAVRFPHCVINTHARGRITPSDVRDRSLHGAVLSSRSSSTSRCWRLLRRAQRVESLRDGCVAVVSLYTDSAASVPWATEPPTPPPSSPQTCEHPFAGALLHDRPGRAGNRRRRCAQAWKLRDPRAGVTSPG